MFAPPSKTAPANSFREKLSQTSKSYYTQSPPTFSHLLSFHQHSHLTHLKRRNSNSNRLRLRVRDRDADLLDARCFGSRGRITVELSFSLAKCSLPSSHSSFLALSSNQGQNSQLTATIGAPLSLFIISISFNGAPAPLLFTPRLLNTASLALHLPAKLACG